MDAGTRGALGSKYGTDPLEKKSVKLDQDTI
jgi:hypothetical protein